MISQGYNGYLPGCPHEQKMRGGHEMATIHAEMNTVTDCAKRGVSIKGADAYITHYPCINCMKALCASGVARVYYVEDYRNDELVSYFSGIAGVPVVKIESLNPGNRVHSCISRSSDGATETSRARVSRPDAP